MIRTPRADIIDRLLAVPADSVELLEPAGIRLAKHGNVLRDLKTEIVICHVGTSFLPDKPDILIYTALHSPSPILDADKTLKVANPRVLALSQATIHLLKTVGVWENLARQQPYTGMQVWNKNGYGEINFGQPSEKTPSVEQALGSMVEPSILNLAIQQKMLEDVQDYRTQVKVSRIERGVGVWIIQLADGTQLKTKLVIGADGANSFVREQAFIDIEVLDYKQRAISGDTGRIAQTRCGCETYPRKRARPCLPGRIRQVSDSGEASGTGVVPARAFQNDNL